MKTNTELKQRRNKGLKLWHLRCHMIDNICLGRRFVKYMVLLPMILALATEIYGSGSTHPQPEQKEIHVAVNGSDELGTGIEDAPYASISAAAETSPASIIIVHEGDYGPVQLDPKCSGSDKAPTVIRSAEGEKAVIHAEGGTGLSLVNVSHIIVEDLEIEGGTHGIYYESTRENEHMLTDIRFVNCMVRGVRGTHGICVYARSDRTPVQDLTIERCEVYDCECDSSETMVLNGNIDGFTICGNIIHDSNNIGIDMIGFEGTAKHPDEDSGKNAFEVDMVRNGVCKDNVVYNISTEGNQAYFEDGEFDLCAGGIYVDGGQNIEIYNNFIFHCDIGLEVATEHSPDENELFRVTGVHVHDNVIADCTGWTGICFGGYDRDLGFTEDCVFEHNTLVDNATQIGVQRSRNNRISANLIIGGETAIEFNEDCSAEDMVNDISANAFCDIEDEDSWMAEYGTMHQDRAEISDGFRSLIADVGSDFVPAGERIELYSSQKATWKSSVD